VITYDWFAPGRAPGGVGRHGGCGLDITASNLSASS